MSEFQLRRDAAALSTHILNMQRVVRKNRSSHASLDAEDADNGRLRHLLDRPEFKEWLPNKGIRGRLNPATGESVEL